MADATKEVVTDEAGPAVEEPNPNDLKSSESDNANQNSSPTLPVSPPKPKIKRDFYQTDSDVVVNFLAKNLKKDEVKVEFSTEKLIVSATLADGSDFHAAINLYNPVRPDVCSYKVLSTKIEVRLRKQDAVQWPTVEAAEKPVEAKPLYPTSAKVKKDWEKVEKEIEKEIPEDDDVNNLFAKIFSSGDENTKRAMMKSMQESGGTVLSTNWDEVGSKKVEVSPPDGMEWKKWDSSAEK